jgi:hypothetical protein
MLNLQFASNEQMFRDLLVALVLHRYRAISNSYFRAMSENTGAINRHRRAAELRQLLLR